MTRKKNVPRRAVPRAGVDDDWIVPDTRPEDTYQHPWEYWNRERIMVVLKSSGQWRIQQRRTAMAWNHLESRTGAVEPGAAIIDVGCGLGFVSDVLAGGGRVVVGIDVIPAMIELSLTRDLVAGAARRGSYHPVVASTSHLPFRHETFRVAVSVSALQWVRQAADASALGKEMHDVMDEKGALVFHFFPKSRQEMMLFGTSVGNQGFDGGFVIDNSSNPRKRRIYLVASRRKVEEKGMPGGRASSSRG